MEFLVYIVSKVLLQTFWGRFRTQFNLLNMAFKDWTPTICQALFLATSPTFLSSAQFLLIQILLTKDTKLFAIFYAPSPDALHFFLDVVLSVCNALLSFLHLATPSDVMRGGPCMSALYPNSRIGWISFPGFPKHHVQTSFSELLSSICLSVIPTGLQFLEGRERSLLLIPLSSLRYTNA